MELGFIKKIKLKLNQNSVSVYDVFTPTKSAQMNYIKREDLEKQIKHELTTPGKQIILFGHSGSGKTTIIRRLLENDNKHYILTQCESSTTFNQILANAFDALDKYIISEKNQYKSIKFSSALKTDYKGIKASLSNGFEANESEKMVRLLPPQLTPQKLALFFGEGNLVWVIEDFHKVNEVEKQKIADVMKIFCDNSNNYPRSKVICIGAAHSTNELVGFSPDLKSRVSEIKVSLLSEEQIKEIVLNGCKMLNIGMSNSLVDKIVYYSSRLGSCAHQMCLDICIEENINKRTRKSVNFTDKSFDHAVKGFIKSNEGTLSLIYESAVKDELGWYILKTLSKDSHEKMQLREISKIVNKSKRKYSDEEIRVKLNDLCKPELNVVYYNIVTENYSLGSPFWQAFLRMQFEIEYAKKQKANNNSRNQKLRLVNQDSRDAMVEKIMLEVIADYRRKSTVK